MISRLFLLLSAISLVAACFAVWQSLRVLFSVARSPLPKKVLSETARDIAERAVAEPGEGLPHGRVACTSCGASNESDAHFCKRCGTLVEPSSNAKGPKS
jgi:uncharacterized paraquat-inducible protein A